MAKSPPTTFALQSVSLRHFGSSMVFRISYQFSSLSHEVALLERSGLIRPHQGDNDGKLVVLKREVRRVTFSNQT